MNLSEKILKLRTARNMSQGDLAEALDVSRQSVSKWETGQSVPDVDKLVRLADLFGVTTDYLLREAEKELQTEPQVVYVERSAKEECIGPKQRSAGFIVFMVLYWMIPVTIFSFLAAGEIREDEAAVFLIAASCVIGVELMACRRHPWATVLWTVVGLVPFWIMFAVRGIDHSIEYLMIVIGLTAAAFGLFLTYRKKL